MDPTHRNELNQMAYQLSYCPDYCKTHGGASLTDTIHTFKMKSELKREQ